ncbi:ornithine cyclodeaminase family domain [Facklamia languida]|uniref:Arginine dihydrolase ArgZ/ArgE-like C-terminal second subdomain domain-containing protein n=1 Tax=Facklamia languida CCUG 37842 TaxID=883113 RepID=H3NJY2_9LACT|nr:hypothetical protein [Facklamia languida]EHR36499.1 hypothetical protein HMPREF9708_01171 [Facklamia languida CCUG 37842]
MKKQFELPTYHEPDFTQDKFVKAPNATLVEVEKDGISPENYHALSVFPEYFKINNKWVLAVQSRMDTVCVAHDTPGQESVDIVEFRNLKKGDKVVVGRTEDGSEGIFVHTEGFLEEASEAATFGFRTGRSRETAFSKDYDDIFDLLEYEKENNGYITWILGTATSLDQKSRHALQKLVEAGYMNAIFCGTTAVAADLELGTYGSVIGQAEYLNDQNSYQNYYEVINAVNEAGGIEAYVKSGKVKDGFVKACIENGVEIVIAGTIRDRLTFPDTYNDVYEAQDAMRAHVKKTSTIIMTSAILFTIASGNMTPSYNEFDGKVRPVYMYTVDIQEFAVNKLSDRGTLTAKSIVTNTQDFVSHISRHLTQD